MSIHGIIIIIIIIIFIIIIIIIIIVVVVVVQLLLSFTFSSASWRFFLSVESSSFNSLISVFVLKTFISKRTKRLLLVLLLLLLRQACHGTVTFPRRQG